MKLKMRLKMKKIYLLFLLLILLLLPTFTFASNQIPTLTAGSAILLDNRTNKILYQKNEDQKMYPASTTKILTAILTLENTKLTDQVTANYDAVMSIPDGYSSANIQIGETLTIEQLLQMLLVHSANDAANILAQQVGGSIDSFVSMMNTKLNELGLINSHFTNTYGKHDENHYTTASDLARLMQYCIKNETFRKIAGSASCAIPATNKSGPRLYTTTNELLVPSSSSYYSYLTSGKTGFTTPAKGCLVSCAYHNDLELVCVVLGSNDETSDQKVTIVPIEGPSNRFTETKALFKYGYDNYSLKIVANENEIATQIEVSNATKETKFLDLKIKETILALIKKDQIDQNFTPQITLNKEITAPIEEGTVLGKIKYTVDGVEYTTDLTASHFVEKSKLLIYLSYLFITLLVLFLFFKIFFSSKRRFKTR